MWKGKFIMKYSLFKKRCLLQTAAVVLTVVGIAGFVVFPLAKGNADYSKIVGQWVRASGGYVLDIQNVQSDGKLEVAYLIPKSINVSKASANIQTGRIELFVELRDKYYPGQLLHAHL